MHKAHKEAMAPWRERRERYAELPKTPLRIVARIPAPVVHYEAPHLDGLLAWCVVMEETQGRGVSQPPRYTPLPLEVAGFYGSGGQLPLWRCSAFFPVGAALRDTAWVHKRAPSARYSKTATIKRVVGRYMERRTPLPTVTAAAWEANCYGNAAEIERLLSTSIAFVGKRRGIGLGEVKRWSIEPWEGGDPFVRDGRLAHPMPVAHAEKAGYLIDDPPVLVGWTPPHWAPGLWLEGWPVGTVVGAAPVPSDIDWYDAVDGLS